MEALSKGRAGKRHVNIGSDHNLVIAKIVMILANKLSKLDVAKLKHPSVSEQFNIKLRNRYGILQDETAITIDSHVRMILLQ